MKKNKKYLIYLLIAIMLITMIIIYTRGKYNLSDKTEHVQNAEKFYFRSDLLKEVQEGIEYQNWNGESTYNIEFKIFNYQDELQINNLLTKYKIDTEILELEPKTISKEKIESQVFINGTNTLTGEIENTKKDDNILVKLNIKDTTITKIKLKITATSYYPYTKAISEEITIKKENFTPYKIDLQDSR